MLYIVELPEQGAPRCWTANNEREFINAIEDSKPANVGTIYDARTIAELMDDHDISDAEHANEKGLDWLAALMQHTAPDFSVFAYRSWPCERFTLVALDEYACYRQYLARDLHALFIFESEQEARAAIQSEMWRGFQHGIAARDALAKVVHR